MSWKNRDYPRTADKSVHENCSKALFEHMQWIALHIKTTARHPYKSGYLEFLQKILERKISNPQKYCNHPSLSLETPEYSPRPIAQSAYHQVTQSNPHKTGTTKLSYLIRRESFRSLKNFKPNEFFLECKKCKILLNVQSFAVNLRTFYFYIPNLLKSGFESTFDLFESIVFENVNRLCIFTAQ